MMPSAKALTLTVTVLMSALCLSAPAYAGGRVRASGYNPETGNAATTGGGYHTESGTRWRQTGVYDASTETYTGASGIYNPSTNQGFTTSTSATRGVGATTNINTVNNGSYECNTSRSSASCVELGQ